MARFLKKETEKVGTAPGSLIFVGTKKSEEVTIDLIQYTVESVNQQENVEAKDVMNFISPDASTWINVSGLHEIEIIAALGELFEIHPLIQEDILNTAQRPKFDQYDDQIAIFLKMLRPNSTTKLIEGEQISMVIGKNYLISFQEVKGDVFNNIRERIVHATTKIRQRGPDYLAFALLDAIVDNYIISIEQLGAEIEEVVDAMLRTESKGLLRRINHYRQEINAFRRTIRPVIEISNLFEKSESSLVAKKTIPFIKDLEDNIMHATEAIEIYKELLNDELGIYHMTISAKLNDILRVLTIFSVIFIPLTFVAGIYGTNFKYFPELDYRYAYPIFWGVMIFIASAMVYYFRRKKWL